VDLMTLESRLRARLIDRSGGGATAPRTTDRRGRRRSGPPDAYVRNAGALLLLYPGPDEVLLPLTVRHDDLPHHPGQVSLPGGAADPGESADHAALREAHEEVGIEPSSVRVLGSLSPVWIGVSGYLVHPIVGVADRRPDFRLAPREVAALIEVPIDQVRAFDGLFDTPSAAAVEHPFLEVGGHRVWGATAYILAEFATLLGAAKPGPHPTNA
jgi:8-oxo-dGTP pyrophosphatase MutT (NUDIX family)